MNKSVFQVWENQMILMSEGFLQMRADFGNALVLGQITIICTVYIAKSDLTK